MIVKILAIGLLSNFIFNVPHNTSSCPVAIIRPEMTAISDSESPDGVDMTISCPVNYPHIINEELVEKSTTVVELINSMQKLKCEK